jgi:C-terminal processing protease CtpA/Prc
MLEKACVILGLALLLSPTETSAQAETAPEWFGSVEERVFGLTSIWAEARYAFPSFEQVPDLDWDQTFRDYVPRVTDAANATEYYELLMEFAGHLEDGHTGVVPPWGYLRPDYDHPPIEIEAIDDSFVIARIGNADEMAAQHIRPGTQVIDIDGTPVSEVLETDVNRLWPRGSRHANSALNVVYLLRGPKDSFVTLGLAESADSVRRVELRRNSMQSDGNPFLPRVLEWLSSAPAVSTRKVADGITYVRIASFEDPQMAAQFLSLVRRWNEEALSGLLIDLRFNLGGRGDLAASMIGTLIDRPTSTTLWKYPHYVAAHKAWGKERLWEVESHLISPDSTVRFEGPIVLLTGGVTASTAEDFAISLRDAGRATLVGDRTAGSAGNPIRVALPGGGHFRMATFRALLPDSTEYVGIGIEPDVLIRPSPEEIAHGRDVVLEKGLEVLRQRIARGDL